MKNKLRLDSESYIHFKDSDEAFIDYDNLDDVMECEKQFIRECDEDDYIQADYLFLGDDALVEMPTDRSKRYAIEYDVEPECGGIIPYMKLNLTLEKVKWYLHMFECDTGYMSLWEMGDGYQIEIRKTNIERTQSVEVWCDTDYDAVDFYADDIEDDEFWYDASTFSYSYEEF